MAKDPDDEQLRADDRRTLHRLGYAQELARCLGAFSNVAISLHRLDEIHAAEDAVHELSIKEITQGET